MRESLLESLACPRDHTPLSRHGDRLRCGQGHEYPIICGLPVLLAGTEQPTHWTLPRALKIAASPDPLAVIDPDVWARHHGVNAFVQKWVVKTNGNLYQALRNQVIRYPIPQLRLPPGDGRALLELGCNWGRWVVAAARQGYRCVGIDPSLEALLAAQMVCADCGVEADFVVADARQLPFRDQSFATVFSYSVLQHFDRAEARRSLAEAGRVLARPGTCLVQMANRHGVRSLWHLARRGFKEGKNFDVRYWTPAEIREAFAAQIGPPRLTVDGYFGLGIQPADLPLLPPFARLVVRTSEVLRRLSLTWPSLGAVADSLYAQVDREPAQPPLSS